MHCFKKPVTLQVPHAFLRNGDLLWEGGRIVQICEQASEGDLASWPTNQYNSRDLETGEILCDGHRMTASEFTQPDNRLQVETLWLNPNPDTPRSDAFVEWFIETAHQLALQRDALFLYPIGDPVGVRLRARRMIGTRLAILMGLPEEATAWDPVMKVKVLSAIKGSKPAP